MLNRLLQAALAQVGVHQQHPRAAHGQRDGQIGRRHGFAVVGHGTGDEQRVRARAGLRHVKQRGAQIAIRFDERMPLIVRLAERQDAAACAALRSRGIWPSTSSSNNSSSSVKVFIRSSTPVQQQQDDQAQHQADHAGNQHAFLDQRLVRETRRWRVGKW